jgi:3-phosphoshikimate 1-carboxyvinyltransferase
MDVPGDVSSAAFLLVAALVLPDAHVRVERVLLNPRAPPSSTCCARWAATSRSASSAETPEPVGWIEARSSRLHGIAVDPSGRGPR